MQRARLLPQSGAWMVNLCAATLLVGLSTTTALGQEFQGAFDDPVPTRYSAMGFAGVAIADAHYGALNASTVAAAVLDGWSAWLCRATLNSEDGHGNRVEGAGGRFGNTNDGAVAVAIALSHTHRKYLVWTRVLPPIPEDSTLYPNWRENDDWTLGIAVRNGLEVAFGVRARVETLPVQYSAGGQQAYLGNDDDYAYDSGPLFRLHVGEVLSDLTDGQFLLNAAGVDFDGEVSVATGLDSDAPVAFALSASARLGGVHLAVLRMAQDDAKARHSRGWEIGALGLLFIRGGDQNYHASAATGRVITHGFAARGGPVFLWLGKRARGGLRWLLDRIDFGYEETHYTRTLNESWVPRDYRWKSWTLAIRSTAS